MSLSNNVNALVKIKKIKQGLSDLPVKKDVESVKGVQSDDVIESTTIKPPLELTILTYDDTQDITFEDTSAVQHTLKTAATAKLVDADGKEFPIDTIIYDPPV